MLAPVPIPFGGMDRTFGFERQKQATTPHCINVWPRQARRRFSLGSRPGLKRFYNGDLAGAVNMMVATDLNEATYLRYLDDDFDGYNYEQRWTTGSGGLTAPTLDFLNHQYYADYHATNVYGLFLSALSQSTSAAMFVHLKVVPFENENTATYRVYFLLNDSSPNPASEGVEVKLVLSKSGSNDVLTTSVITRSSSSVENTYTLSPATFTASNVDSRWLRISWIKDTGVISIWFDYAPVAVPGGSPSASFTITNPTTNVGTRIGWSMQATASGDRAIVDRVRVNWTDGSATRVTNVGRLLCGGGGKVYHESSGNDLAEVDATYSLLSNEPVMAATRLTKAYIADWGDINYTNAAAVVAGGAGALTIETGVNLVSTYGVSATSFVVEIVSTSAMGANLPAGAYSFGISNGSATNSLLTLLRQTTAAGSGTASIRVRRGPKIYDASAGTLTKLQTSTSVLTETSTYGIVPVGCHLACEYRDRLVMCDDTQYYGSRIGDFTDFGYLIDPDDPRSAWSGTLAGAGSLGRRPTALIPFSDDYLLISAADMILRMTGDIAFGGRIEVAAKEVGIMGPRAWCITPENVLYFMARTGLYRMAPGGGSSPEAVSKDALPDELQNLSEHSTVVALTYDPRDEAIDITIGGKREHQRRDSWRLDMRTGALWPWRLPDGIEPTAAITAVRGYFYGQVQPLIGCRDGRIRFFDREAVLDDGGTAIDSILTLGPLRGGPHATAVRSIEANMSRDSRPTYVTVETGATPEDAVARAVVGTSYDFRHTLAAGRNRGIYARGVGGAACLSLRSLSGGMWRVEELAADLGAIERVL